ncbi:MAG: multiheme c-type cytochrome [Caldilineaceae bacterium]
MGVSLLRPWCRFATLFVLTALLWLASLYWSAPVKAEPLMPSGALACAKCHEEETRAWQVSPHATAEKPATCTDCHGQYVEDHPKTGVMTLAISSAVCTNCHQETFEQWQGSTHAKANVECTSCHVSHSQTLRLTDETLCISCHKQPTGDQFHVTHWAGQVTCTGCHLTPAVHEAVASSDPAEALTVSLNANMTTPSHDFVLVSAQKCLDCHREDVQNVALRADDTAKVRTQLLDKTQWAATLSTQLKASESQVHTLGIMTPVALGLGISFGGFVGILFMLLLGRSEAKKEDL